MWPFKKKKSKINPFAVIAPLEVAAGELWTAFLAEHQWKNIPFQHHFISFFPIALKQLRARWPKLEDTPDQFMMIAIARGVVAAGSVTKADFLAAIPLPANCLD